MGNGTDQYGFDYDDPDAFNQGLSKGRGGSSKIKFDKGDGKGFLDNFKKGAMSYFKDAQEGKSDTDKYLDFLKETRGMAQGGQFGSGMGGFAQEVAEGLTTFVPPSTQQMFIPGQEGKPGLFSVGGAIRGGIGGFMKGGPAGALGGAAMGGFM